MGKYVIERKAPVETAPVWAKRIYELLIESNLTQEELAKKGNTTAATLSGWIRGSTEPKIKSLMDFAKALNVSMDYLVGLSDSKSIKDEYKKGSELFGLDDSSMKVLEAINKGAPMFIVDGEFVHIGNKVLSSALINYLFSNYEFWNDFDDSLSDYIQVRNEHYEKYGKDSSIESKEVKKARYPLLSQFEDFIEGAFTSLYKSKVKTRTFFKTQKVK